MFVSEKRYPKTVVFINMGFKNFCPFVERHSWFSFPAIFYHVAICKRKETISMNSTKYLINKQIFILSMTQVLSTDTILNHFSKWHPDYHFFHSSFLKPQLCKMQPPVQLWGETLYILFWCSGLFPLEFIYWKTSF